MAVVINTDGAITLRVRDWLGCRSDVGSVEESLFRFSIIEQILSRPACSLAIHIMLVNQENDPPSNVGFTETYTRLPFGDFVFLLHYLALNLEDLEDLEPTNLQPLQIMTKGPLYTYDKNRTSLYLFCLIPTLS
jgi:hypothetical protein